jgi:hypothetical protein
MSDNPPTVKPTEPNMQILRFHDGERWNCALVKIGTKRYHAVHIDDCGVRVSSGPKEEVRTMTPLLYRGAPYPMPRLLRHMRRVGRERGITEAAKSILQECSPNE